MIRDSTARDGLSPYYQSSASWNLVLTFKCIIWIGKPAGASVASQKPTSNDADARSWNGSEKGVAVPISDWEPPPYGTYVSPRLVAGALNFSEVMTTPGTPPPKCSVVLSNDFQDGGFPF